MRHANVSVAAMYLWESPYEFTQYTSSIIQRAAATYIVPKPFPLPYWQTPILPFSGSIWSYVLSSFLIGASVLFIVNDSHSRMGIQNRASRHPAFGLFDSIFTVLKMSLFQCVRMNIRFLSNIAIFTAILTFALVIGNLYCGKLHCKEEVYLGKSLLHRKHKKNFCLVHHHRWIIECDDNQTI